MNKLKIAIPLIFLASCQSDYFSLLAESPQRIINSFKSYSPGEDYIQNQQYSFISVELGQQNATLVLESIDKDIFTWVGRGNVVFKTYKGFIISTLGLEHNFEIVDPIVSIEKFLIDKSDNLFYNFDNPKLYELQVAKITSFYSKDQIKLSLTSNDINWDVEIRIKYDVKGLPEELEQSLHPFLKPAKIKFFYKF